MSERIRVVPVSFAEAKKIISDLHRHHQPPRGHKFSIAARADWGLVGVICTGRPVARRLDDGSTAEVNRLATDGTPNVCSLLLGAAARAAEAMGYEKIVTYTLPEEGGASLRAAGWQFEAQSPGGSWSCPGRPRSDKHPLGPKWRWSKALRPRSAKLPTNFDLEIERLLS